jgi:hypothetical protein
MSKEMRKYINTFKKHISNESFTNKYKGNDDVIKLKLFKILKSSEYVEKFNFLWSPNLLVGADPLFVDLDEKDFFDTTQNVYDIINGLFPYEDYEKWKNLYYTLVLGYRIKDKNSNVSMMIGIRRNEKSMARKYKMEEFETNINPNYVGKTKTSGEKIFVDGEILNVFGFDVDDFEHKPTTNDFVKMSIELNQVAKTVKDYKLIFKYLDAII